jgi:D-aspartate ligase
MSPRQHNPGAVVLGSDFKALGIVRSLGRKGIPSVVIDNVPRSAWFSRYVEKRLFWRGPMDGEEFLSFLITQGKMHRLEQWVLIPAQDDAFELVARNTAQLSNLYRLVTQEWGVVQWAHDKRLTHRLAEKVGVPYPKTWYPIGEEQLGEMEMRFPVIIKPAISIHMQNAVRLKALPAESREELLAQYRLAAGIIEPGEIMVQEIIPGGGQDQYSVASFCKDGRMLMSMSARRTRQYPIDYGLGSSFVEALEVPPLFELTERLLRCLGASGMVEVEFKYDRRDNEYKLLDINLRPWGWHTLCIACGLDFPYIHYRDVLGEPLPSFTPRYDRHWVRMLTDIPAGIQEIRSGITTPLSYIRSLAGRTVFSVFDWRDPVPAVGDLGSALVRGLRGRYRTGKRHNETPLEISANHVGRKVRVR